MGLGGRAVLGVWRRPGRHRRRWALGRSEGVGLQSGVGGSWLGFPRGPGQGRSQHRVARSEGQSGCNSPWPAAVVGQGLEPHTVVRLPPPDLASPPLTADTGPALARGAPGDQGRDKVLAQSSQGEKGAGLQGRALPGKSEPSFPSREGQWRGRASGSVLHAHVLAAEPEQPMEAHRGSVSRSVKRESSMRLREVVSR